MYDGNGRSGHDAGSNLKAVDCFKIKPNGAFLLGVHCIGNNFDVIGSFYSECVMVLRCFVYHDSGSNLKAVDCFKIKPNGAIIRHSRQLAMEYNI